MKNYLFAKMEDIEAEGIDFIPMGNLSDDFPKIIASYTKEQLREVQSIPRTGYKFWKKIDGKKIYILS